MYLSFFPNYSVLHYSSSVVTVICGEGIVKRNVKQGRLSKRLWMTLAVNNHYQVNGSRVSKLIMNMVSPHSIAKGK